MAEIIKLPGSMGDIELDLDEHQLAELNEQVLTLGAPAGLYLANVFPIRAIKTASAVNNRPDRLRVITSDQDHSQLRKPS